MTQKELADSLCIKRTAVANWETGRTNPRAELLPKIARILNCTVDELLQPEAAEQESEVRSE